MPDSPTVPWKVDAECALVLSDAHQNIRWADAVIEREQGNFDHLVFLGDAFDSFHSPPVVAGFRATARWWTRLIDRNDATVLLGNHDLPYLECWSKAKAFKKKLPLINSCSGFANGKAIDFAREVTLEHRSKVRIFTVVNGWLLSHAGFRENYWRPFATDEENLQKLWEECNEALDTLEHIPRALFMCGRARGGEARWGGPLWCDFDEFQDNLPLPQMFGHTPSALGARQIGRSYCIDGYQTCYALIRRSGEVEIRSLPPTTPPR